jgi:hypothetical protein
MPVIIHPLIPKKEANRSRSFNKYVCEIASEIAAVRVAGNYEVAKIAQALTERGVRAPSGGQLTYTTMRRILKRLHKLKLGPGPLSISEAVSRRPYIPRRRSSKPFLRSFLVNMQEHDEGRE